MRNKNINISRQEQQSKFEKKWAEIFFSHINNQHNFDYQAKSLPNNVQVIDVMGISKGGNYQELRLELTEAKKWIPEELNFTKEDINNDFGYFDNNQVQQSIDRKIKKYNKKLIDVSSVILLVQGSLSYDWMENCIVQLKKKYIFASFKGIYYVCPDSTKNDSFVMEIKNAFN